VALTANGNSISYFEYKVINELMHSHIAEFGADLRAIIRVVVQLFSLLTQEWLFLPLGAAVRPLVTIN